MPQEGAGLATGKAFNGPVANKGHRGSTLPQDESCWEWLHTYLNEFMTLTNALIWKAIPSKTRRDFQGAS